MAYEPGLAPGTATSSLENLTQGWAFSSAPFPVTSTAFSQVGDFRYYAQRRDGVVIYYELPAFGDHAVSDVSVNGAALTQDARRFAMVRPPTGEPFLVPSLVQDAGFRLHRLDL